jgi:xylulokinase
MLLGIDVGTTHTKAGLYDREGTLLAHATAATPLATSAEGLSHYDPAALWQVAARLIREIVHKAGVKVVGLAVASMGEAGVTLDAEGVPTYPVIPWFEGARSEPQMAQLCKALDPERWFAVTGLYPNPIHTIAKWLWLKENAPEAWEKTLLWLSVADYVGFKLTGCAVAERSLAARTMAYDVSRQTWSEELLTLADVDARILPPLADAGTFLGEMTRDAAELTGLPKGTPVFTGGHDHICAALACGALVPRVLLDSLGTAEALTLGLPRPPQPEAAGGFGTGPHVVPGHSYLLGGVYSSGGALAWVKKLFALNSFDELRALAESTTPAASPLFIAQFHGAAPPFNDPGATGAFVEVTAEHGRAQLVRAVYEGVAFEIRAGIEALEQLTKTPVEVVRMVGGMAEDPLWSKIRAAVLGRALELARYPDMVTLGAALLAGLGAGLYASPAEAVARTYRPRGTFSPEASWQHLYEAHYARYVSAARALRQSRVT